MFAMLFYFNASFKARWYDVLRKAVFVKVSDTTKLNNVIVARYKKINKLINDFQIRGVCRKCDSFISSIVFL